MQKETMIFGDGYPTTFGDVRSITEHPEVDRLLYKLRLARFDDSKDREAVLTYLHRKLSKAQIKSTILWLKRGERLDLVPWDPTHPLEWWSFSVCGVAIINTDDDGGESFLQEIWCLWAQYILDDILGGDGPAKKGSEDLIKKMRDAFDFDPDCLFPSSQDYDRMYGELVSHLNRNLGWKLTQLWRVRKGYRTAISGFMKSVPDPYAAKRHFDNASVEVYLKHYGDRYGFSK